MNRRKFMGRLTLLAAWIGTNPLFAERQKKSGRCGNACADCIRHQNGECAGCGTGSKQACIIFRCNSRRNMNSCAECKACPCSKHSRIGTIAPKPRAA